MKNLSVLSLVVFFFGISQAQAQFDASYLIPTEETDLQPLAVSIVNGANLIELEDGSWVLSYNLPWTIAGTDIVPIEVKGKLNNMRSDDRVTKADCTQEASDIPAEFTQNLSEEFLPEIVCKISYRHDLVVQLDGRTGDFIDLVMQNFSMDEALNRLFLRDNFMGEPIGFLGLSKPKNNTLRY